MTILATMLLATGAAGTSCPAERAVYSMKEAPGLELRLPRAGPAAGVASDLYAQLRVPADADRPAHTIWFQFTVSNGYQTIRLVPVTDPLVAGEDGPALLNEEDDEDGALSSVTRFLAFDGELAIAQDPPRAGEAAPAHVLLPDIGLALWYNGGAFGLTDSAGGGANLSVPTAIFQRSGCD